MEYGLWCPAWGYFFHGFMGESQAWAGLFFQAHVEPRQQATPCKKTAAWKRSC
ncbi:MAG: hypothetical protein JWM16_3174, partial [Verrucomicrobiales bacterium]|nr:hypothetical protein [Verrucomicrobiales bacterium]